MAQRHAEQLGRALGGTYLIDRLLGQGGMGAVYSARHLRTGGLVAVKILESDTADAEMYRRFQNEARIVSALRHPNIVQVVDFDEDDSGQPFMVMELLEGEDLHRRLRRLSRLPLAQALELARQVAGALHAAHQLGVIHRDVKPQNIFLCQHQLGDELLEVAKVVDFGISKIRDTASQTQDKTVLGTPYYMSPEAARAQNADLDGRTDQWGLGVILYRALSGKLPFDNPDPLAVLYQVVNERPVPLGEIAPALPRHVSDAVMRAMSKNREDRFLSMADFARALEAVPLEISQEYDVIEVAAEPAERTDETPAPVRPPPAAPRWRALVLAVCAVVTAFLAATAVLLVQRGRLRAPPPVLAAPAAPPAPEEVPAPPIVAEPIATPLATTTPPIQAPAAEPARTPALAPEGRRPEARPRHRRREEVDRANEDFDKDF